MVAGAAAAAAGRVRAAAADLHAQAAGVWDGEH